jgi:pimeloyl-ACP methyl ester carboxylesterase
VKSLADAPKTFDCSRDRCVCSDLAVLKPVPPLLAIFGTQDRIVPESQAKFFQRVPGAKIVIIEGSGHSPQVETPGKVLELIRAFETQSGQP